MIIPTIALTAISGQQERLILAQRYHIHTIVTCHQPGSINLSQNTNINESIVIAKRREGVNPPTQFIQLDRMPHNESEVEDLHRCLLECGQGVLANDWGEVSYWEAELIEAGDWTSAIWRSTELAKKAAEFANCLELLSIKEQPGLSPLATGRVLRGSFERAEPGEPGSFPILKSKGANAQTTIRSTPDEHWRLKKQGVETHQLCDKIHPKVQGILKKAGHLLVTAGQDTSTGRLVSTADDKAYVGNGWMPIIGLSAKESKAAAVFVNSTAGRLQLMRNPGRKLAFPTYSAAEAANIRIPNIKNERICDILSDCWEHTKDLVVPQFRDGECEVRLLWDEAVAEAMGWDGSELARLRHLLHKEPHVRGLGYNQYADEVDE